MFSILLIIHITQTRHVYCIHINALEIFFFGQLKWFYFCIHIERYCRAILMAYECRFDCKSNNFVFLKFIVFVTAISLTETVTRNDQFNECAKRKTQNAYSQAAKCLLYARLFFFFGNYTLTWVEMTTIIQHIRFYIHHNKRMIIPFNNNNYINNQNLFHFIKFPCQGFCNGEYSMQCIQIPLHFIFDMFFQCKLKCIWCCGYVVLLLNNQLAWKTEWIHKTKKHQIGARIKVKPVTMHIFSLFIDYLERWW